MSKNLLNDFFLILLSEKPKLMPDDIKIDDFKNINSSKNYNLFKDLIEITDIILKTADENDVGDAFHQIC